MLLAVYQECVDISPDPRGGFRILIEEVRGRTTGQGIECHLRTVMTSKLAVSFPQYVCQSSESQFVKWFMVCVSLLHVYQHELDCATARYF